MATHVQAVAAQPLNPDQRPNPEAAAAPDDRPGSAARAVAAEAFQRTLMARQPLDEVLDALIGEAKLPDARDAALARAIGAVSFRFLGTITGALESRLEKGTASLPRPVQAVLATAAAQILFLDAADHAAIDIAVALVGREPKGERFKGVANAVLRRIAREAEAIRAEATALPLDTPPWLLDRWRQDHGDAAALRIAAMHREDIGLDITVTDDAPGWAARLDAVLLPSGSLRLSRREAVERLPGFEDGAWWVQDAAAAVPARLLHATPGERVLDLCAAPGGKTMQLAATGATVTAVDRSAARLRRLGANLDRTGLSARVVTADALAFKEDGFDAILIDAPCTATGTIRRHPDIAWTKTPDDEAKLAGLQARLIDHAVTLLRPGGRLVFCTCSLQAAEGEDQARAALARNPALVADPIRPEEVGVAESITPEGWFRALPSHILGETPRMSGWGGFFAARFLRRSG
jgi:16S rRNA (cytosine967-C5)-methyltransferase